MNETMDRYRHPSIQLADRTVGGDFTPLVVAEIGTSHGGRLDHARRLVDAAAEAGADCAKFQLVIADEIVHPKTGNVPLPGGTVPLFERFRELEREPEFYAELMEYTRGAGLLFLCSAFGRQSSRILRDMGVQAIKIASPELNHAPLLREVAGYELPLLLSTGVSLLGDIEQALQIVGREKVALLHCVTAYPAPITDYNLRAMGGLEAVFGVPVGVSDHTLDPFVVPALSSALGAAVVEKHLTLSKEGGGLDDQVALTPEDFRAMVGVIHRAHGDGAQETFRRLARTVAPELLNEVLGSGVKHLAASEENNYLRTNRSLHAVSDIPAGTPLTRATVAVLRTEKELRPGISPHLIDVVIGRKAVRNIPAGEGIVWDDLLAR